MRVNEYSVRILRQTNLADALTGTPENVFRYWKENIGNQPGFNSEQEHLAAIFLTPNGKIKGHNIVTIGVLDSVGATAREVFRAAIIAGAFRVVLAHNHPNAETQNDVTPSNADIGFTAGMVVAGDIINLPVIDHIVIGENHFTSIRKYTEANPLKWKRAQENNEFEAWLKDVFKGDMK